MVSKLFLILVGVVAFAQDLNITAVSPADSDRLAIAYAKYQRAKHEWVKVATGVANHEGFQCPAFSRDFKYLLNDPICEEDAPVVKDLPDPKKASTWEDYWPSVVSGRTVVVTEIHL